VAVLVDMAEQLQATAVRAVLEEEEEASETTQPEEV
jgi:hypothetical protein